MEEAEHHGMSQSQKRKQDPRGPLEPGGQGQGQSQGPSPGGSRTPGLPPSHASVWASHRMWAVAATCPLSLPSPASALRCQDSAAAACGLFLKHVQLIPSKNLFSGKFSLPGPGIVSSCF